MNSEPELPYNPIVFIKSGVIGGNQPNLNVSCNSYDFTHRHILQPHYLNNHQAIFYILFHTPSIYNWLRTVPCRESELLNNYISNVKVNGSINVPIDPQQVIKSLEDYANKWEVAKLTFTSKVYISKVKELGGSACPHLSKTQQKAMILNYDKAEEKMKCCRVKCKECRREVEVQSQTRELAEYFISKLGMSRLSHKEVAYEATIVLCKWKVFIKAANKIWYFIDLKTAQSRSVGTQNVEFRQSLLVFYRKQGKSHPPLSKAEPLSKSLFSSTQQPAHRLKQPNQQNEDTRKQPKQMIHHPGLTKKQELSIAQAITQYSGNSQKIRPLKYEVNKVVLPPQQRSNSYVKEVSKQFVSVKAKDAYQLDYDRGKLKKKKEKRHYVQPDFNEVFAMVKSKQQQGVSEQTRKIKKSEKRTKRREINFGPDSD